MLRCRAAWPRAWPPLGQAQRPATGATAQNVVAAEDTALIGRGRRFSRLHRLGIGFGGGVASENIVTAKNAALIGSGTLGSGRGSGPIA